MLQFGLPDYRIFAVLFSCCLVFPDSIQASDEWVYSKEMTLNASAEKVWLAITQPEIVSSYYLAPLVKLEARAGGQIIYGTLEQPLIAGRILDVVPGVKLQHSFQFDVTTHSGVAEDTSSRVTYELISDGKKTVLKLTHDQFGEDRQSFENVTAGWPIILGRLKERVENDF